jgi:hypothetical protein
MMPMITTATTVRPTPDTSVQMNVRRPQTAHPATLDLLNEINDDPTCIFWG